MVETQVGRDLSPGGSQRQVVTTPLLIKARMLRVIGGFSMNATAAVGPTRTQNMRALERANKVRVARAALKHGVALGEIDVAEVILSCPWETRSMRVAELLMSQRRWGISRCNKTLALLPISEHKSLESMTDRQRHVLAALLMAPEGTAAHAKPIDSGS
jgi:hypothetical protein